MHDACSHCSPSTDGPSKARGPYPYPHSRRGFGLLRTAALFCTLVVPLTLQSCSDSSEPPAQAPAEAMPPAKDLMAHIDPLLGTGGLGFGFGSAYPGPAVPFAMIHASPDTRAKSGLMADYHPAGYLYQDSFIAGFSLTHFFGTGAPDYGAVTFMPTVGMTDEKRDPPGYAAGFSHDHEQASPGYYRVSLSTKIDVEISTTKRASIFRITFADPTDPVLLVDMQHTLGGSSAGGAVTLDPSAGGMSGRMHVNGPLSGRFGGFDIFFKAAVDVSPASVGVWDDQGLHGGQAVASGDDVGGWLRFPPGTKQVQLRTAISFVDEQGAANNLASELPGFDFDATKKAAEAQWRHELENFSWHGVSDRNATIWGTAIYHALLMPTLMSDQDGRFYGADKTIHTDGGPRYSDFSLWDTYRTLHPWLLFTEHPAQRDFVRSLVGMGEEGGAIPRWSLAHGDGGSMIGTPGEIVVAESAAKGLDFDQERAYKIARVTAFGKQPGKMGGRRDYDSYVKYGYVPVDLADSSVSKTQEYAVADAALRDWAKRLGKLDDAKVLAEHAQFWTNLYDEKLGFFHGRKSDGTWMHWPGPTASTDEYSEGNAWQYLWMVPQDPEGLADRLGGPDAALARLRELFALSEKERPLLGHRKYYWQANEPDITAPWFFAAWGSPDEQLTWTKWIINEQYDVGPAGLPGNDDGGTMSSWALFAAAGLYPVVGTDRYIVGIPMVRRLAIKRKSGTLTIETDRDPLVHGHLLEVQLDGAPLKGAYVTQGQLRGEHKLLFTLDSNR